MDDPHWNSQQITRGLLESRNFSGSVGLQLPLIVAGASRGGTSLVSLIAKKMGFDMGSYNEENHEDPRLMPVFYPAFSSSEFSDYLGARASRGLWGFKLPKAARHLPEIRGELAAVFVLVFRNPLDVGIGGWLRGGEPLFSMTETLRYFRLMTEFTELYGNDTPIICVSYEKIATNPLLLAERLSDVYGIPLSPSIKEQVEASSTGDSAGYKL